MLDTVVSEVVSLHMGEQKTRVKAKKALKPGAHQYITLWNVHSHFLI